MFRIKLFLCALATGLLFVWMVVGIASQADASTSRCEDRGYIAGYIFVGDVISIPEDPFTYRVQLCHLGKHGKFRIHKSIANTQDEIAGLRKYAKKMSLYLCRPSEDRAYMFGLAQSLDYRIKKTNFAEQVYFPDWEKRYAKRHNCHR